MRPTLDDLIKSGAVTQVGNALYSRCEDCGSIVRINKPIFGSLHICAPDRED